MARPRDKKPPNRRVDDSYCKFRTRWRHVMFIDQQIRGGADG